LNVDVYVETQPITITTIPFLSNNIVATNYVGFN